MACDGAAAPAELNRVTLSAAFSSRIVSPSSSITSQPRGWGRCQIGSGAYRI